MRLRQIILNLMSNAIKFTSEGKISVTWLLNENNESTAIEFLVTDTGIGIAPDRLTRTYI
jgi:signal transduction histidine kinase